jgi:rhodanese-related sulfurtransferase
MQIIPREHARLSYRTISPTELDARLKRGADVLLIDVREPVEFEFAHIEGTRLLPCHHGIRSAHVCTLLAQQGFEKLFNLAGGIDRWSHEVDARVPRY